MLKHWEGGEAMIRPRAAPFPLILVDIDTQFDFLDPDGKRPIANPQILNNLRRLFQWIRKSDLTLVSSLDVHRITDQTEGVAVHCLEGTAGIAKLPFTLLPRRILVQTDNTIDLPFDLLTRYRQVLFVKHGSDLTSNPKADRLLTEIEAKHFALFGVGLEESIRSLALSLMARRKVVWLVIDACGYWDEQAADLAARQIEAKGAKIVTTEELTQLRPARAVPRRRTTLPRSVPDQADRSPADSGSN